MDYKTPNVYVEEVSTLPPSVAGVATAIPAFIGYTEKALDKTESLKNKAVRISSLKEYENYFGYADSSEISVNVNGDKVVTTPPALKYSLYYQMQMFFKNGGSACYIVSVGDYKTQVSKDDFLTGLKELEKEDEPTLILFPDGFLLSDPKDYYDLCVDAMNQCNELKDRFTIVDVINKDKDDIKNFRSDIGMNNLKYAAAYYPYLKTSLNFSYTEATVSVAVSDSGPVWNYEKDNLKIKYKGSKDQVPSVTIKKKSGTDQDKDVFTFSISGSDLSIDSPSTIDKRQAKFLFAQWDEWNKVSANNPDSKFELMNIGTSDDWEVPEDKDTQFEIKDDAETKKLSDFKDVNTGIYNKVKAELAKLKVTLPPGSSMAGVYSATDRDRGVWKAPANVSLNSVIGPVSKITDADQENLNVDATGGKSVNAIRSFAGKGTLVWGARTLAGNDNEWRYVNVRRLFIYMEESLKKATYFAVFEPNTAMTWLKVKTMAESFLDNIWRQGGLAGASADQAYFVHVGLGTTMTTQDILEGRMIVEIGVAAVRPAEFIVLRFSHKLQEA